MVGVNAHVEHSLANEAGLIPLARHYHTRHLITRTHVLRTSKQRDDRRSTVYQLTDSGLCLSKVFHPRIG